MTTVDLINVSKTYGSKLILNDMNLSIHKGEFIVVVGPSGCGKSTLLRLVAGLEDITSGKILINGVCVNAIPPAQRNIAMVFQNYALYPHMTVFENMAYGLKMKKLNAHEIHKKVSEVANMLQLTPFLRRKPFELSGGQRQRVAMGRAIVRSPAIFLFDEPLSHLDAKLRTEMRHEIKKLHQKLNTTCLYVTHDQTEAMTMGDRLIVLNNGVIEQIDTPQTLYQNPASLFVASFIGHYPINILPAKIDLTQRKVITEAGISFPLPSLDIKPTCGEEVLVAIRPENLEVIQSDNNPPIVNIAFVDDMGSDKLIYLSSSCEKFKFTIRASLDQEISSPPYGLKLKAKKANLFHPKTGLRLGGWNER
jgi:sn-glycerol 3-phosphate transport system ATP-binding protein